MIRKAQNQFSDDTRIDEKPLTRMGNSSPIISHGMGPRPREKKIMKETIEQIGIHPKLSLNSEAFLLFTMKSKTAKGIKLIPVPKLETTVRRFRPKL